MGERLKNSLRLFYFVLLMGIVGPIHFQSYPEAASFLMLSYIVNFILALFSLLLLYWGLTKKKENLTQRRQGTAGHSGRAGQARAAAQGRAE